MESIYSAVVLRPKGKQAQLDAIFVPRNVWRWIPGCNGAMQNCLVCLGFVNGFVRKRNNGGNKLWKKEKDRRQNSKQEILKNLQAEHSLSPPSPLPNKKIDIIKNNTNK